MSDKTEPDFEAMARKHGCNCITPDGRLIAEPASVKLAREAYALGRAAREPTELERRLREATEWRPIETAPRDGRPIIMRSGPESWPGFWHDGSSNYWKRAGFYEESDRNNLLTAKPIDADGWLPLPAAPEARDADTVILAEHDAEGRT